MKKVMMTLVAFVMMFVLTGCGTETLSCTMSQNQSGIKMNQDMSGDHGFYVPCSVLSAETALMPITFSVVKQMITFLKFLNLFFTLLEKVSCLGN